ncbi:TPA: hypothetical protein NG682_001002 [Vibrio parahaemolyticus]|uniref:hypothetical protein n=1 Tax=Vibrio parahaemolyticus TaxID=670 RepID=UPI0011101386|nr:hypothetical protein [Vibrio parahaemolyticus]HCE3702314.1 hypothetical protein [Vibrio parahaemolyticus]
MSEIEKENDNKFSMGKSKIDFKKVLMGLLCGTLIGLYFISLWNDGNIYNRECETHYKLYCK